MEHIDKTYLENIINRYSNFWRHDINEYCDKLLEKLVECAKNGRRELVIEPNDDTISLYYNYDYMKRYFKARDINLEKVFTTNTKCLEYYSLYF